MDSIENIIKKSQLQDSTISCDDWLLPEVSGRHRVSGKEKGKVAKARKGKASQENDAASADKEQQSSQPLDVDAVVGGEDLSLSNSGSSESTPIVASAADTGQPEKTVASTLRDRHGDAVNAIPDSIRDFNEPMTLTRLKTLVDTTRQEAYETGFLSGQAEGHKKGLQESQAEIDLLTEKLSELCSELASTLEREREALSKVLTSVIIRIAEVYSEKQLSSDVELIQKIVAKALDSFSELDQRPTVYLSPQDLDLMLGEGLLHDDCDWNADSSICAGGCRIKGKFTEVDATLERQIDQIARQMFVEDAG